MTDEYTVDTVGVRLPTGGQWVDVPNSPFQICAWPHDVAGTFHVRARPTDDWTVPRSMTGEGWNPEPFVFPRGHEYKVGITLLVLGLVPASLSVVTPEVARRAAARLLAIAELAEHRRTETEENP